MSAKTSFAQVGTPRSGSMDRGKKSWDPFQAHAETSAGSRPIGVAPERLSPHSASQRTTENFHVLLDNGESSRSNREREPSDTDDQVNAYRSRFERSRNSRPRHNLIPRKYRGIRNNETINSNQKNTMNHAPYNPYNNQVHFPPGTTHNPTTAHDSFNFSQHSYHIPTADASRPPMPYQSHWPNVGTWSQPTAYHQSDYRAPSIANIPHGDFHPNMERQPPPDMGGTSSTMSARQAGSQTIRKPAEPLTNMEEKQNKIDRELQRALVEKVVRETWEAHIPQILEGTHSSYISKIREATHDLERLLAETDRRKAEAELYELQCLEAERRADKTLAEDETDVSTLESKSDPLGSEMDTTRDEGSGKRASPSKNDAVTAYKTTPESQSSLRPKTEFGFVLSSRVSPNESEGHNTDTITWAKKYGTYAESVEDADLPSPGPRKSDQSSWRLNDLDQKLSKLQEQFALAEDRRRETEEKMHVHYQGALTYQKEVARSSDTRTDGIIWSPSTDSDSGHLLGNESASDYNEKDSTFSVFKYQEPDSSAGSDGESAPGRVTYEAPDPPSPGVRSVRTYAGRRHLTSDFLVSSDRSLLRDEKEQQMQVEMERFKLGLRIVRDELVDPIFRTLLSELKDSKLGGAAGLSRGAVHLSEVSSPVAFSQDWSSTRRNYMLNGLQGPLPLTLTEAPTEAQSSYTPRTYLQALLSKQLENSKEIMTSQIREPPARS